MKSMISGRTKQLLHHLQHAKNQLNKSVYFQNKADFRVSGLKGHSHV